MSRGGKLLRLTWFIHALVVAAACSRGDSPSSPAVVADVERPTEESLLAAFMSERVPKTAHAVSPEGAQRPLTNVTGPRAWVWTGEVRNDEGLVSPFTTQVTVTALRIEKTATEAPTYVGFVSWECTGTGPFRCFENRYSRERTEYEYRADSRQWQKVEMLHPRR